MRYIGLQRLVRVNIRVVYLCSETQITDIQCIMQMKRNYFLNPPANCNYQKMRKKSRFPGLAYIHLNMITYCFNFDSTNHSNNA
jgi:hypothetical protein